MCLCPYVLYGGVCVSVSLCVVWRSVCVCVLMCCMEECQCQCADVLY